MSRHLISGTIAVAAGVVLVIIFWRHGPQGDAGLQHWLAVHTGTLNEPGPYYGFWSGFGSDIGEISIVGGMVTIVLGLLHKTNCHHAGCWRIGRHHVDGTPWCNRHHEDARQRSTAGKPDLLLAAVLELGAKYDRNTEALASLADAIRLFLIPPSQKGSSP